MTLRKTLMANVVVCQEGIQANLLLNDEKSTKRVCPGESVWCLVGFESSPLNSSKSSR